MEHVLVFASILIGVAVTDELMSFHRLLRRRDIVRWDWLPLAVALLVLLTLVQIWWSSVGPSVGPSATSITIGQFMPDLVELILLVLLAVAVLPDEVPGEGIDLRRYYEDNRAYIWTLYTLAFGWIAMVGIVQTARGGATMVHAIEGRIVDLAFLALMGSLIVVRRRWWHVVMVLLLFVGPIGWMSRSMG